MNASTLVVIPSITFPVAELAKITGVGRYEERMLYTLLLLAGPEQRVVYVTSQAVDPAIIEYYLRFVPDAEAARRRLTLVTVNDANINPLSEKLLARPDVVGQLRDYVDDPTSSYILPFNVGATDQALADALGLRLFGARPELAWLGSKSGSRQVARRAGVEVLPGAEDLFDIGELEAAVRTLGREHPSAESVVIKLNNGFSGQGNAMVALESLAAAGGSLREAAITFCASEESWTSFAAKVEAEGAIVEELVRRPGTTSPSVQLRISEQGRLEVLSTHDQVLGGPGNQVYLGCRFPADRDYRTAIREEAVKVGEVLAAEGVIGSFGIDFLMVPDGEDRTRPVLSEINLRVGGTTHTFWMARLVTGGCYDVETGEMTAGGRAKAYMASDNVKSEQLIGISPAEMIEAIDRSGLGYDPRSCTGVTLHLLGALPGHGKMGVICIADDRGDADDLYKQVVEVALGARPSLPRRFPQ